MIIVRLKGGLGNQMFQYAFGSVLAKKKKKGLLIDNRFFDLSKENDRITARDFELTIFNNEYKEASLKQIYSFEKLSTINKLKRKFKLNYPKKYNEQAMDFNELVFDVRPPVYLNGYFQSYRYLSGYEEYIENIFRFPILNLDIRNKSILKEIQNRETISIHVRRGDYLTLPGVKDAVATCSLDYYNAAIDLMLSEHKDAKLVFFSDEIDWVKEAFGFISQDKIFIDHNKYRDSWKDMCLMSSCTHNIIANSTFSWWAAWLNTNVEKKVVAPKKWFTDDQMNTNDLIPLGWIRL